MTTLDIPLMSIGNFPSAPPKYEQRNEAEFRKSVSSSLNRAQPASFANGLGWTNVLDYKAKGDGVTDDTAAIQAAANAAAGGVLYFPPRSYVVSGSIALSSYTVLWAYGATITQTANTFPILDSAGVAHVSVMGGSWVGVGSGVAFSDTNSGLIHFTISGSTRSTDIMVRDCFVSDAYNGITVVMADRVWVVNCRVQHWLLWAICTSRCTKFFVRHNTLSDCDQTGAANAYGVTAGGDEFLGYLQIDGVIEDNFIDGVPSWDGIMTHDADTLLIRNNTIRNVRHGIDIGPFATGIIRNIRIVGNEIVATTQNTYGGTAAPHAAIQVLGWDASNRVLGVEIEHNVCKGFNRLVSGSLAGNAGVIVVAHADEVKIVGNTILDTGTAFGTYAGVMLAGTLNRVAVADNIVQGSHGAGAIRAINATIDVLSIDGNVAKQTTTTDNAILFSGTSVSALSLGVNPTNSTTPFVTTASGYTWSGYIGTALLEATDVLIRGAAGTGVLTLDTQTGATSDDTEIRYRRAGVGKWRTGCNIDGANVDHFNIYNDGTTSFPLVVNASSNRASWLRAMDSGFATLTDAATIATDANLGNSFKVTLGGNRTMGAPTNPVAGQRIHYTIVQDGTGGRTLAWNAVFKVTWSDTGNTASKRSTVAFIYDGTNWNQDGAQTPYV